MSMELNGVTHINATGGAASVAIGFAPFLIKNEGTDTLYFCEGRVDVATAETGFPLAPGEMTEFPMTAEVLSISAGGKAAILTFGG